MAYCTANDVSDAVAARLGMAGRSALPAHVPPIAADSVDLAYEMIRSVLIGRGITAAQIDAWESRVKWNKLLATYYTLRDMAQAGKDYDLQAMELLKKTYEDGLKVVQVVQVTPVADAPTPAVRVVTGDVASTGRVDTTDEDNTIHMETEL